MIRRIALASFLLAAACSSGASNDPGTGDSDIIGGFDAKSPSLDAIGTIGFLQPGQPYQFFCSATLIGPHTVLTAKHCAVDYQPQALPDGGAAPSDGTRKLLMDEAPVVFAIGPNATAPARTVKVRSVDVSPIDEGGFMQLGSDVSVYTLDEDVTGVTPMKVATAPADASMVGKKLTAVGYGYQDEKNTALGTRKAGALTLRAVTGKPLEAVFGSAQGFFDAVAQVEGQSYVDANKAAYQQLYDMPLLDSYEMYAGAAANNAQVCNGDSGGPLLQKRADGSLVVVGVASGVVSSVHLPCQMGAAYATFGPKVQELVKTALEDPCNGVGASGVCDGTVVRRCTRADEGPKRLVEMDCADLGQVCFVDENGDAGGTASCVDATDAGPAADASTDAGPSLDGGAAPDATMDGGAD